MEHVDAAVDGVGEGRLFAELAHQAVRVGVHYAVGTGHGEGEDGRDVAGVLETTGMVVVEEIR